MIARSTPEHQQIEQRIGTESVRAVHADAGALAHRIQALDDLVGLSVLGRNDLAVDVGRYAAHLVMDRRHDRNGFLGDVDIGEVVPDLVHRGQPLHDRLCTKVGHVEHHIVLVRTAASTFLDLLVHAPRDEVARRKVLQRGRIALHETLAVAVAQDRALASAALGQQHPGTGDTGRVELPELHVFKWDAGASRHAQPITGIDEGVGGGREDTTCATGGHQRGLRFEDVHLAGLHLQRRHADHVTVGIADQIERHPLDEEVGARLDVLLIERVQHRVAGAIGSSAGTLDGLLAIVGGVTAERTLVDRAIRVAVERHAEVLELIDDLGRLAAHELDRILVTQPVRTLHGVIEVVVPVVLGHVAQTCTDATLRGDRM